MISNLLALTLLSTETRIWAVSKQEVNSVELAAEAKHAIHASKATLWTNWP